METYFGKLHHAPDTETPADMKLNFTTVENQDFGRFLVSTRSFNVGDLVWEEEPLLSGPCKLSDLSEDDYSNLTCVTCFQKIENACEDCPECGCPCCSYNCSQNGTHKNYECKILAKLKIHVTPIVFEKLIYLRAILSKEVEPEMYDLLHYLKSEYSELPVDMAMSREEYTTDILKFLNGDCQLDVSKDEVCRLWNIFQINNYLLTVSECNLKEYMGELTYYYGCFMANSCSPNLLYSYLKSKGSNGTINWKIQFHAKKPIKPGDVLSHAYSPSELTYGTIPRQLRILEAYNFKCKCRRCKDKTEEGTFYQALICPKCKTGNQLPMNSDEMVGSPWDCDVCKYVMDADSVKEIVDKLKRGPYSLLENTTVTADTLMMADRFLEEQKDVLHQNHYLMHQCAIHWLRRIDVVYRTKDREKAFKDIMKRVRIYLPLCLKHESADYNSDLLFSLANLHATFIRRPTLMFRKRPLAYRLRISKRILAYLESSLIWRNLNKNSLLYENYASIITRVHASWSVRVIKLETEIEALLDQGLESVNNLFG